LVNARSFALIANWFFVNLAAPITVGNGVFTVQTSLSHCRFWCSALSVEKNHSINFFVPSSLTLFQLMDWYKAQISLLEALRPFALSEDPWVSPGIFPGGGA
jgi:hypothetical protein